MNCIFDKKKELTTKEALREACCAVKGVKMIYPYNLDRLKGKKCPCNGHGIFDLFEADDPFCISQEKRFMRCRKCGGISHL